MGCKLGFKGEERVIEEGDLPKKAKALAARIHKDDESRTGRFDGPPIIVIHLPLDLDRGAPLLRYEAIQCKGHFYEDHHSMIMHASCGGCRYQK